MISSLLSLSLFLVATNFLSFLSNGRWYVRHAVLWRRDWYLYGNNVTWMSVARRRLAPGGLILQTKGAPIQGPPVKPVRRGPRVWHAAHPRIECGARLRGIPTGFYPAPFPPLPTPYTPVPHLFRASTRRRGVFSPGRSRSWHQRNWGARSNDDLSGISVAPAKEYMLTFSLLRVH